MERHCAFRETHWVLEYCDLINHRYSMWGNLFGTCMSFVEAPVKCWYAINQPHVYRGMHEIREQQVPWSHHESLWAGVYCLCTPSRWYFLGELSCSVCQAWCKMTINTVSEKNDMPPAIEPAVNQTLVCKRGELIGVSAAPDKHSTSSKARILPHNTGILLDTCVE